MAVVQAAPELARATPAPALTHQTGERDLALETDWIYLRGGALQIGSEGQPHTRKATISLTDRVSGENINTMGDRGIMISGDTPVIVGPDGPSLGGFVCPAVVASAEMWKVGQLRPGDPGVDQRLERLAVPVLEARGDLLRPGGVPVAERRPHLRQEVRPLPSQHPRRSRRCPAGPCR